MDPLWVIVEGPDGAGKSWFAKEAAHVLASHGGGAPERPCVLQKLSYDSPRRDYCTLPEEWLIDMHVVQDRGALSGPVYEPIMRGDDERLAWLNECVAEAAAAGAVAFYVHADNPTLERRLIERGDDYVSVDKLLDIQAGYDRVMDAWCALGGFTVDFDTTHGFPDRLHLELVLSAVAGKAR